MRATLDGYRGVTWTDGINVNAADLDDVSLRIGNNRHFEVTDI
jgi:hypothetical protein